jgi:hypothetical protein
MQIAPARVQNASHGFHEPCNFHDNTHPAHTGTMAAGKVFGRAARSQFFMSGVVEKAFLTTDGRQD